MREIIKRRYHADAQDRLYRYADDVLEYRMQGGEQRYHERQDLGQVFMGMVEAAKVIGTDRAGAHRHLLAAAQATDDRAVKMDVYSVVIELGFPCPAHGTETYIHTSGSRQFIGGEVDDDLEEHLLCSLCGEEVEYMPSVQAATMPIMELAEIAPV